MNSSPPLRVFIFSVCFFIFGLCKDALPQTDLSSKNWKKLDAETRRLIELGKYAEAMPYALRSAELAREKFGDWHPKYAYSLEELGELHIAFDELDEAEKIYLQTAALYKKQFGAESEDYAYALGNLANLYKTAGNYPKAVDMYFRSMEVSPTGGLNYHLNQQQLAYVYTLMGRYAEAEIEFREVLTAFRQNPEWEETYLSSLLNDVTWLYELMGRYQEARVLMEEALEIDKRTIGTDNPWYYTTLNNLANLYGTMGLYDLAVPLMEEVVNSHINSEQKGSELAMASPLNNLAEIYSEIGRLEDAIALTTRAKKIVELRLGKENPNYITFINSLGGFYQDLKDYAKADSLLSEARKLGEVVYGEESFKTAELYDDLATLYMDMEQYAKAEKFLNEALNGYFNTLKTTFPLLSEEEENAFLAGFRGSFELFHTLALKRQPENPTITASQYDFALQTKGLLFQNSSLMRKRVSESDDLQLKELFAQWQKLREEMARVYTLSVSERVALRIDQDSLEAEVNLLEKQLSERASIFARSGSLDSVSWREIQQQLAPGEAAVEIIRHRYYDKYLTDSILYQALIITPETRDFPMSIVLENGNDLEGRFSQYYNSCMKYQIEDQHSYQQFWKRIGASLGGIKKVYFSADGFYHSINLQGLYNRESGNYLADELEVQLVTSTRSLLQKDSQPMISDAALFGFPDYNGKQANEPIAEVEEQLENVSQGLLQAQRFFTINEILELPGTRKEIAEIEQLLEQKQITCHTFIGNKATEEAVKAIKSPSLLHIATHGYFLKNASSDSPQKTELIYGISPLDLANKPLLRSGLLFSDALRALKKGGDGVLTAYEAVGLDLEKTELVVLSACETGLGELQIGEGVYGLQRALHTAGADAVLMSLWKVSDNATQLLMVKFYQNLLIEGQNKQQALSNAQRWLRTKYPHPYYWAGFVMVHG